MPKFGDIYVCRLPFTSGTFSKPRPVLVLFDLEMDVVICLITSASHSGPLDVELRSRAVAGLERPSVVRLNRLVTAERWLLTRYLDSLAASDAAAIEAAWSYYQLSLRDKHSSTNSQTGASGHVRTGGGERDQGALTHPLIRSKRFSPWSGCKRICVPERHLRPDRHG